MTIVKLPLPEEKLDRLLEVAKREDRQEDVATLTVNGVPVAPSITAQPQGQVVNAGSNATFTVTAAGTAPLSYQWRFNNTNLASATNASYTRTNVQANTTGEYTVVVTNAAAVPVFTVNGATASISFF